MKSTAERNKILDLRYGGQAYVPAASVFVALCTTEPTAAGGGNEANYSGYSRIEIANSLANFPAAANGVKTNANPVTFGTATTVGGTIVGVKIFDALVAGNMLDYYVIPVDERPIVTVGKQLSIAAGQMILTET
jgi:hypothetical protein